MSQPSSKLQLPYLKTIWERALRERAGVATNETPLPYNYITAVFDALGVGIEPTYQYLYGEAPTYAAFEDWILTHGDPYPEMIALVAAAMATNGSKKSVVAQEHQVLDAAALQHWEEEGYVVIPNAISKQEAEASVRVIQEALEIDVHDKRTWYKDHKLKQGIMVQLFRHPVLDANRFSEKIQGAFQQLWKKNDLVVSRDRVSFNPPENEHYSFPGPHLHWDVSLKQPIPYGLQGLLYLTDTPANQGAFTLVPGFHHKIDAWLHGLPAGANPRTMDLQSLGPKPVAANAGDFIIWNHKLPHGSAPNLGAQPRIVQYINYLPIDRNVASEWI